jgi:hypothetical protein
MTEPIKTFCPASRATISLSLEDVVVAKGLLKGHPCGCDLKEVCVHCGKARCLLVALSYATEATNRNSLSRKNEK